MLLASLVYSSAGVGQQRPQTSPSRADILRGEYGPYRANNDLISYDLDVRVDPEKKFISGKTTIRFRMLRLAASEANHRLADDEKRVAAR